MEGTAKREFDPAVLDTLARELGVGTEPPPDTKLDVYRIAAGKLARLLAFAETSPEAWRMLLRYLWEKADEYARESSRVDLEAPRDQVVNKTIYNAGRAKSLQELVFDLQPKTLKKQLDKTLALCESMRPAPPKDLA